MEDSVHALASAVAFSWAAKSWRCGSEKGGPFYLTSGVGSVATVARGSHDRASEVTGGLLCVNSTKCRSSDLGSQ